MPANPSVYQPHDGHAYIESPWPDLKGKCNLCSQPEHLHQVGKPKPEQRSRNV